MYLPCCVDDDVLEGFDFFYCRSTLKSAFYFSRVFLNLCLNFFQLVRLSLVLGLPAMESLLGITAKDCVILAADSTTAHSISVMKHDQTKMFQLGQNMAMVVCGEAGDPAIFGDFMKKNLALYNIKHQYSLGPHGAAHYIRRTLAESIRSRRPYGVFLLLAGCSEEEGPSLYYMDYFGSLAKVPYGAHGYGAYFSLSIMDRLHKEDCSREEAIDIMRECIKEIQHRLIINLPSFKLYCVSKDGVEEVAESDKMEE